MFLCGVIFTATLSVLLS